MKHLQRSRCLRALVAIMLTIGVPGQSVQGLQVSPPSGAGAARDCEAERLKRYKDAITEYDDALFAIAHRRKVALQRCQDTFNIVDIPACNRKYSDALNTAAVQSATATAACGAVCLIAIVPPAVMAPPCAVCIGGLYVLVATQIALAETQKATCIDSARNTATVCVKAAQNQADADSDIAKRQFERKIAAADNDYQDCKARTGG